MSITDLENPRFVAGVPGPNGTFIHVLEAIKRGDNEVKAICIVGALPEMVKPLKSKLGPNLEDHEYSNWENANAKLHLVISCAEGARAVPAIVAFITTWMAAVEADSKARNTSRFDDSAIVIAESEPARTAYRGRNKHEGNHSRRDHSRRAGSFRR